MVVVLVREKERFLAERLVTAGEVALVLVVVPHNDQLLGGQLAWGGGHVGGRRTKT